MWSGETSRENNPGDIKKRSFQVFKKKGGGDLTISYLSISCPVLQLTKYELLNKTLQQ